MAIDHSSHSSYLPTTDKATRYNSLIVSRVLVGAFLGVVWGASLRTWMALLAVELGDRSQFSWLSTVGGVLLPAMLMGALLGAAVYIAETSDRKHWRWLLLSPLLLITGPVFFTADFFSILIQTGMGSGAIGVALIGMLGGYALPGFGARWTRWVAGLLIVLPTIAAVFAVFYTNVVSVA